MGIYDRDYSRGPEERGFSLGQQSMIVKIILANIAVYVIQLLSRGPEVGQGVYDSGWFTDTFSLQSGLLTHPWRFYQLLTYGFLHSPDDFKHILFNMIGLFFLGRVVENYLGSRRFLLFYLTAIVFSGVAWLISEKVMLGSSPNVLGIPVSVLGASGGVVATVMLVVFYFPKQMVLLWFAIPVPLWALGLFIVAMDLMGAINQTENVAYTAHLGGALYAFIYFRTGWSVEKILPKNFSLKSFKRKTKLRVHHPPDGSEDQGRDNQGRDNQDEALDRILRKIQEQGQDSLTRREKKMLEEASRRYQDRRR